jgi:A/G-specific adenine glycosylase
VIARAVTGHAEAAPPSNRRDLEAMEAVLPEDPAAARVTNAAVMELGAVVCTARAPGCDACPLAAACAWRLAGYPAYGGARKPTQKRFEGSDRQVRGLILGAMRAADAPVPAAELDAVWPDPARRERALAGLIIDGLVVGTDAGGYALPG